jgi:transposase
MLVTFLKRLYCKDLKTVKTLNIRQSNAEISQIAKRRRFNVETTSPTDVETTSKKVRKRKSNRRCNIDVESTSFTDVIYRRRNDVISTFGYRRVLMYDVLSTRVSKLYFSKYQCQSATMQDANEITK